MEDQRRYACPDLPVGEDALNSPAWQKVRAVSLSDIVSGEPPFLSTSVQIVRDDRAACLYVRFFGDDDEIHSVFRMRDETLYREDVFELFLSTDGKLDQYIELESSPHGVLFDGLITYDASGARHLDTSLTMPGWQCAVRFNALKCRIETVWTLPYAGFQTPPRQGLEWRINAFRIDHSRRGVSYQGWQPTGLVNFHVPEHFGYLTFE